VSIDEYLQFILLGLSLDPEDGGKKQLRTIGNNVPNQHGVISRKIWYL
jgi:hypothetical protein